MEAIAGQMHLTKTFLLGSNASTEFRNKRYLKQNKMDHLD